VSKLERQYCLRHAIQRMPSVPFVVNTFYA
jgi:hypothetical protein